MSSPLRQSTWKSLLSLKTDKKVESLETEKIPDMILDSIPDFVAVINKEGHVKESNLGEILLQL